MSVAEYPHASGLVLAAGGSRRLGAPKQLLPYAGGTLLEHVLSTARDCRLGQVVCALGGGAGAIRGAVDLSGVDVVENPDYGEGCSSSIAAALGAVDPRSEVLVLLLGDQPGVGVATVHALLDGQANSPLAVCRYDNGRGHPFAFARGLFAELATMHGDKAVWKLLDRHADQVCEVPIAGPIPPDVDTWDDYATVLAQESVA